MRSLEERLLSLLHRRRRCLSIAEAAAILRATPSEVTAAAIKAGVEVTEGRLCVKREEAREEHETSWRIYRAPRGCCVVEVAAAGPGLPALVEAAKRAAALARRLLPRLCREGCRVVVPAYRGRRYSTMLVEGVAPSWIARRGCGLPQAARRYDCMDLRQGY